MNFLKLIIRSEFPTTIGVKSIVIDFETAALNRLVGDKDLNRVILPKSQLKMGQSGPKWTKIGPKSVRFG